MQHCDLEPQRACCIWHALRTSTHNHQHIRSVDHNSTYLALADVSAELEALAALFSTSSNHQLGHIITTP
jgi:hypothetical protein